MKRIGKTSDIISSIIEYENISHSIDVVLRGSYRKKTRIGRYILKNRDKVIHKIQEDISSGTFCIKGFREMTVKERGKERHIQAINIYERIGCNAIMHVVENLIFKRYIRTTAASIKNRGMHDLKEYIQRDLEIDPEGTKYCYKFDIKKFYESIDQEFMMYALRRMFKDKRLLSLFEKFTKMLPTGISIGLRSSQAFGNILLSMFIDHYLKDQLGVKHFYRYCDDGIVLSGDKKVLWRIRNIIHGRAEMMHLSVKSDERVFPIRTGVDFLGYVIYSHNYVLLRKRNKKSAARKLHGLKSKKRRQEVVASLFGQCKHANCRNLFKRLTGKSMSEYKKLSSTGIKPKYADGKKRFNGNEVNLADLVGEEFLVLDFEKDVVTRPQRKEYEDKVSQQRKYLENYTSQKMTPPEGFVYPEKVPKPIGKYVISIRRNIGKENETDVKAFTGDAENKSILDQMKEQDLLGHVLCSVKSVRCKNFNRYLLN